MTEVEYTPDLDSILRLMAETDNGPVMTAVVELLRAIDEEHAPHESGDCKADGCQSSTGEPEFNVEWPCRMWLDAQRVSIAWLLEQVLSARPALWATERRPHLVADPTSPDAG